MPLQLGHERADVRVGVYPAGVSGPQRGRRSDVRLARLQRARIDGLERDAVGGRRSRHSLELSLFSRRRDDELAAAHVRHAVLPAERIQARAALVAEPRLQRIRRMVQAGMNHAAVVRGRFLPGPP